MPYCVNCGQQYTRPQNYCRRCGLSLSTSPGSFTSDSSDASTRALSYERSYWHIRRKHAAARESNDSLQMFVSCVGVVAILQSLGIVLGPSTALLFNTYGWLLFGGMAIGAFFKILFDLRYGYSLARSLVEVALAGSLTYLLIYGSVWFFYWSVLHSGKPFFTLPLPPTPTPRGLLGWVLS